MDGESSHQHNGRQSLDQGLKAGMFPPCLGTTELLDILETQRKKLTLADKEGLTPFSTNNLIFVQVRKISSFVFQIYYDRDHVIHEYR